MSYLRQFIRKILENSKPRKKLILEPDLTEKEEPEQEASVVANIAGVTTPLGTGPTYPVRKKDKRKSPATVAGRSFGGAKPAKKK